MILADRFRELVQADLLDYDFAKYVEWLDVKISGESWGFGVPGRKSHKIRESRDATLKRARTHNAEMYTRLDSLTLKPTEIAWYTPGPSSGYKGDNELPASTTWDTVTPDPYGNPAFWQANPSSAGIVLCVVSIIVHDSLERITAMSYPGELPGVPNGIFDDNHDTWRPFEDWADTFVAWPHDYKKGSTKGKKNPDFCSIAKLTLDPDPIDLDVFF